MIIHIIWRILPSDNVRLIVSIISLIIEIVILGYLLNKRHYKGTINLSKASQFVGIKNVILCICGICLAYFIADDYWMHLSIVEYIECGYDLYILCLMMILSLYSIYVIFTILHEIAANIKTWRNYPKVELLLNLLQMVCILVITHIQLVDMRYIYNHEYGGYDKTYLLCKTFIYISINIILSIGFRKLKQIDKMQKQLAIMQVQNENQLEKYIELNKKYEDTSKVVHDVKKHLDILETLIKEKDSDAEKYRKQMYSQLKSLTSVFKCQNKILCVIMSQKIMEAENKGIKVYIDMVDVDFNIIEDIDMTAIFVNLWDNAIEANIKLEEEKRKINIVIGQILNNIIISFENAYDGNVIFDERKMISSKGEGHGFGTLIIKESIKKYKGMYMVENNNEYFNTKIIIPMSA